MMDASLMMHQEDEEEGAIENMQQVVSRPDNNKPTNIQKVVITAITLFAVAGFVLGFGVGAFARPPRVQQGITLPIHGSTAVVVPTATPSPTAIPQLVGLGCPQIAQSSVTEKADGTTTYTLAAQAVDTTGGICDPNNKPVHMAGIACKLWLIPRIPEGQKYHIAPANLPHIDTLANPITGYTQNTQNAQNTDVPEVPGLQFDPKTPQTQICNDQGQGSWKYTIAPTTPAADYDLIVFMNWNGKFPNWYRLNITVKSAAG